MLEQSPGNFGNARVPYDWYQNLTHVIITIRIANLKENDVKVTIINDALDVMCQLIDGRQFRMHFNLYKTVMVAESNWAVDTSKLVINLRKSDRKRWHSLETIPDKSGTKPKSFIGIVNIREAKSELSSLISATEFSDKEGSNGGGGKDSVATDGSGPGSSGIGNSNNAITITQTRHSGVGPLGVKSGIGGNQIISGEDDGLVESSQEPISLDYNWYQTDNYINLVIHVPNIKVTDGRNFLFYEDDINIILTDNTLNWICNFPTGVTNVNFKLYREINSGDSRYEISPCRTKIEIKLRKLDESYWPSFVLEGDGDGEEVIAEVAEEEEVDGEVLEVNGGDVGEQEVVDKTGSSSAKPQNNGEGPEVIATKSSASVNSSKVVTVTEDNGLDETESETVTAVASSSSSNSTKIKPSAPSTRLQATAH